MYTNTFNSAAFNEVCNGAIVYDAAAQARAAVYGHKLIFSKGNVQHTFHVETPINTLAICWQNLIKN